MLFSKPEGIVLSFLPNDGLTTQRYLAGPYPSLEPYHSYPQRGEQSEAHQESLCQQATLFWKTILSFYYLFLKIRNLRPPEFCTAIMNLSLLAVVLSLYAQTIASVTKFPMVDSS